MAIHDDLLEQARHLSNRERTRPRQASLTRAVSAAYYALFHLLIAEAALNWKQTEQRHRLCRLFQHGVMKQASRDVVTADGHLGFVANTFIRVQIARHTADYDTSERWTRTQVSTLVAEAAEAFKSWRTIRRNPDAQAYLLSLLGKPRS